MLLRMMLLFVFWGLPPGLVPQSAGKSKNSVHVKVQFSSENTPLKMELYDVAPSVQYSIAKTAVTKDLAKAPLGKKISDQIHFSNGEQEKTFALVMHNESDKAKYFYAVPHTLHPGSASFGLLFECLCNHHVYKIPPRHFWYRIVRLKKDPSDAKLENLSAITIDHQIVEVSEDDVQKKYKTVLYEEENDRGPPPAKARP